MFLFLYFWMLTLIEPALHCSRSLSQTGWTGPLGVITSMMMSTGWESAHMDQQSLFLNVGRGCQEVGAW